MLQGSMDALFFSERECFAVLQGSMDALFFKEEAQQQLVTRSKEDYSI